jgi:hypothetical protein
MFATTRLHWHCYNVFNASRYIEQFTPHSRTESHLCVGVFASDDQAVRNPKHSKYWLRVHTWNGTRQSAWCEGAGGERKGGR